jgi:CBS domain-containing protein
MKVADILKVKGSDVIAVKPTDTVRDVAHKLVQSKIGAVVVSRDGSSLDGIISERDIARAVGTQTRDIGVLNASDLMTRSVITCGPGDSIRDVAKIMTENRIRHVPVSDGSRLVGLVSIGDILKHRLDEVMLETRVLRDIALSNR